MAASWAVSAQATCSTRSVDAAALALFALGSALSAWAYVVLPLGAAWLVFAVGFPLGFFGSGIFAGLAVYLAEEPLKSFLLPTRTSPVSSGRKA
jgi:uncharacterized membrane protein